MEDLGASVLTTDLLPLLTSSTPFTGCKREREWDGEMLTSLIYWRSERKIFGKRICKINILFPRSTGKIRMVWKHFLTFPRILSNISRNLQRLSFRSAIKARKTKNFPCSRKRAKENSRSKIYWKYIFPHFQNSCSMTRTCIFKSAR